MKSTIFYLLALISFFAGGLSVDFVTLLLCEEKGHTLILHHEVECSVNQPKKTQPQPDTPVAGPAIDPTQIWPIVPPTKKDKK